MVAKDHFARALTIWMEFLVYFFWTNGTALFFHWGNKIDWTVSFDRNFRMPVSRGRVWVLIMSTRNMASELPLVLDVLSEDLEIVFFFLEKGTISSFKLLKHPHFVRETSNQHPHFSPRCSSGGSTLECERKTQVPTTKRNSFSPVGLPLCSKTSANTTDEQRHTM